MVEISVYGTIRIKSTKKSHNYQMNVMRVILEFTATPNTTVNAFSHRAWFINEFALWTSGLCTHTQLTH